MADVVEKPGLKAQAAMFAIAVLLCLGFALLFYEFSNRMGTWPGSATIVLSFLLGLPFSVGALAGSFYALVPNTSRETVRWLAFWTLFAVLCVGAVILREGLICLLILLPIWLASGALGILFISKIGRIVSSHPALNCSLIALLPFVMLGGEAWLPQPTDQITVRRSVVIEAPASAVRPLLLEMRNIGKEEGRWNISQDLLGVPRPLSAVVEERETGLVREAAWRGGVTFEEHIYVDTPQQMRWRFVFPNDSVARHTDRHISPDGANLRIESGGYLIEPISPDQTRLTLDTRYEATTPVNAYASLWGELVLGDIQSNVLQIIKDRAERKPPRNTAYTVL